MENLVHAVLVAQLERLGIDLATPPDAEGWKQILACVSESYCTVDESQAAVQSAIDRLSQETTQLNEQLRRQLKETNTLLAVSQAIGSPLDTYEAVRRVARELARALGADMVGVYLRQ